MSPTRASSPAHVAAAALLQLVALAALWSEAAAQAPAGAPATAGADLAQDIINVNITAGTPSVVDDLLDPILDALAPLVPGSGDDAADALAPAVDVLAPAVGAAAPALADVVAPTVDPGLAPAAPNSTAANNTVAQQVDALAPALDAIVDTLAPAVASANITNPVPLVLPPVANSALPPVPQDLAALIAAACEHFRTVVCPPGVGLPMSVLCGRMVPALPTFGCPPTNVTDSN